MKCCDGCGRKLETEETQCPSCGGSLRQVCPACGALAAEDMFCPVCGALLHSLRQDESPEQILPETEEKPEPDTRTLRRKVPKKLLLLGGIVLALAAVTAGLLLGRKTAADYVLYYRDGYLMLRDLSGKGSVQLSEVAGDAKGCVWSADGSSILFCQGAENSFDLVYCRLDGDQSAPTVLGQQVTDFQASPDLQRVVYQKQDGRVFLHDRQSEKRILNQQVIRYAASPACGCVALLTPSGALYIYTDSSLTQVASDVRELCGSPTENGLMYYRKRTGYYRYTPGAGESFVASPNIQLLAVEDGKLYYSLTELTDRAHLPLSLYLTDSLAESDALLQSPEPGDYETLREYNQAFQRYSEKMARDHMRSLLETAELTELHLTTLYYYDGTQSRAVAGLVGDVEVLLRDDEPVLVIETYDPSVAGKTDISELESAGQLRQMVTAQIRQSIKRYLVRAGGLTEISAAGAQWYCLSPDGSMLYYMIGCESGVGDLCGISMSGETPGQSLIYDTQVDVGGVFLTAEQFVYTKTGEDGTKILCCNGEEIPQSQGVCLGESWEESVLCRDGSLLFYTDCQEGTAVLRLWRDGEVISLADHVSTAPGSIHITGKGNVLYIREGVLYTYNGKESVQTDVGVTAIALPGS